MPIIGRVSRNSVTMRLETKASPSRERQSVMDRPETSAVVTAATSTTARVSSLK